MPEIPEGFGQITWEFTGSGVPTGAVVTLGFDNNLAQDAATLAELFHDMFGDEIMPSLIQNVGLINTIVKLGPNDDGPRAEFGGERGGADLSAQAPPAVAYLVRKQTIQGGRHNQARMFVPGVDETEVDQAGNIAVAKFNALQAAFDALYGRFDTANITPVVLHNPPMIWTLVNGQPRRAPAPGGDAPAPTDIASFTVSGQVATQRRRQRR